MKGWIIQSNEPVEIVYRKRVYQLDQAVPQLTNRWDREILEWTFSSSGESVEQAEHHRDMLRYHGGNKVFWFDGGIVGKVTTRQFIGYGDGVQQDFHLPDRWVYAPSLVMSVNWEIVTAWSLNEANAKIRFDVAPADGALIQAEEYERRVKGYFVIGSDDRLISTTDNFKSRMSKDIMIREFPY